MATVSTAKPSKWFSSKTLKLSLPLLRSKPKSPTSLPSLSTPKNSSKEEQFREVFRFFDSNGDGKISAEELRVYFTSIGESVTRDVAQRVISEFDIDGDNLLEFRDFVRLMERDNEGNANDLKRAFEMFEVDKGSGCITPKGLQVVLSRLGDAKSHDECEAMIRVFDLDGNGVLDFHEFYKMMT